MVGTNSEGNKGDLMETVKKEEADTYELYAPSRAAASKSYSVAKFKRRLYFEEFEEPVRMFRPNSEENQGVPIPRTDENKKDEKENTWMIEDDNKKFEFVGRKESGISNNYYVFVNEGAHFVAYPLKDWYNFVSSSLRTHSISLEDAEARLADTSRLASSLKSFRERKKQRAAEGATGAAGTGAGAGEGDFEEAPFVSDEEMGFVDPDEIDSSMKNGYGKGGVEQIDDFRGEADFEGDDAEMGAETMDYDERVSDDEDLQQEERELFMSADDDRAPPVPAIGQMEHVSAAMTSYSSDDDTLYQSGKDLSELINKQQMQDAARQESPSRTGANSEDVSDDDDADIDDGDDDEAWNNYAIVPKSNPFEIMKKEGVGESAISTPTTSHSPLAQPGGGAPSAILKEAAVRASLRKASSPRISPTSSGRRSPTTTTTATTATTTTTTAAPTTKPIKKRRRTESSSLANSMKQKKTKVIQPFENEIREYISSHKNCKINGLITAMKPILSGANSQRQFMETMKKVAGVDKATGHLLLKS